MFDDLIDRQNNKSDNEQAASNFDTKPFLSSVNQNSEKNSLANFEKVSKQKEKSQKIFEEKISHLRNKGKKRGRLYFVIGVSVSLLIFVVGVVIGYMILGQINSLTNDVAEQGASSLLVSYLDEDNSCAGDPCCLASLQKINRNEFPLSDQNGICPPGLEVVSLDCENSLSWCELVEFEETEEFVEDINNYETQNTETASSSEEAFDPIESVDEIFLEKEVIDSDNDGLKDQDEERLGTASDNPDTDGDGFLDGEEVKQGYNPLGNGELADIGFSVDDFEVFDLH